ncbi:hypothetical protein EIN_379280 [Entamoeba invadens IP1]|uniref:Uncharacterized protein n=1 Tax=Entamoeba invadens IP1 TaxID=370355 RepID=A0A0A1UE65_ENTIV|nr:hypothetical protein EIN_379280 [Entamoeba invadens IP1]ELP92061.1 hypothetical protein EIN_379280 [Entamoeba invadens IP1]|eukprot:XP_004258832.1 hypothetical protein EIN_379280 [Entamoeba invadens IP1]
MVDKDSPISVNSFNVNDTNAQQIISESTCGDVFEKVVLFGHKRLGVAGVSKEYHTSFVIDSIKGGVDQIYAMPQMDMVLALQKGRIEVYQLGTDKNVDGVDAFDKVNQGDTQTSMNADVFCVERVKEDFAVIAKYEDKKKIVSIGLLESNGHLNAMARVFCADSKVYAMCFLGKSLVLAMEDKIIIISPFGDVKGVVASRTAMKKGPVKILKVDDEHAVASYESEIYLCLPTEILQAKVSNAIVGAVYQVPNLFIVLKQSSTQNVGTNGLYYYPLPLKNTVTGSPKSIKSVKVDDVVNIHATYPMFIKAKGECFDLKLRPDKVFESLKSGLYESTIKVIDEFPEMAKDPRLKVQTEMAQYCYALSLIEQFFKDENLRTATFLEEIFYRLRMSHENILLITAMLTHTVIKSFFPTLSKELSRMYTGEWEDENAYSESSSALKIVLNRLKSITEKKSQDKQNTLSPEIQTAFLHYLSILLYKNEYTFFEEDELKKKDTTKRRPNDTEGYKIFLTTFLLVLYSYNPDHARLGLIVSQTDYLLSDHIIDFVSGNTLINYYIKMNYLDGIFNIKAIGQEQKKSALKTVATTVPLTEFDDPVVIDFDRKCEKYLKEFISTQQGTDDEINEKLGTEVYELFGGKEFKAPVDLCVKHIKSWTLADSYELKNETRLRIAVMFLRKLYSDALNSKARSTNLDWLTERITLAYLEYFTFVATEESLKNPSKELVQNCCALIYQTKATSKECFYKVHNEMPPKFFQVRCCVGYLESKEEAYNQLIRINESWPSYPERDLDDDGNYSTKFIGKIDTVIDLTEQEIKAFLTRVTGIKNITNHNYREILLTNLKKMQDDFLNARACKECALKGSACETHKNAYIPFVEPTITRHIAESILFTLIVFGKEKYFEMVREFAKKCGNTIPEWVLQFLLSFFIPGLLDFFGGNEYNVKGIISSVEDVFSKEPSPKNTEITKVCLKRIYVPIVRYLRAYFSKNTALDSLFLIDCYLAYLKLPGNDQLEATKALIDCMSNPIYSERIKKASGLSWRLQCRIKHHVSFMEGLRQYFVELKRRLVDVGEDEFIKIFDDRFANYLSSVNTEIGLGYRNGINPESYITLIRQFYRPFSVQQDNILVEIVLHCVCLRDHNGYSPLLNRTIWELLQKNSVELPFKPKVALTLFSMFYPIIPLEMTQKQMDWIFNIQTYTLDQKNIFFELFDTLKTTGDLIKLTPAIHYFSHQFSQLKLESASQKSLVANAPRRYFKLPYGQICKLCGTKIALREHLTYSNGQFCHVTCH